MAPETDSFTTILAKVDTVDTCTPYVMLSPAELFQSSMGVSVGTTVPLVGKTSVGVAGGGI